MTWQRSDSATARRAGALAASMSEMCLAVSYAFSRWPAVAMATCDGGDGGWLTGWLSPS
jgi:hypothetical protein